MWVRFSEIVRPLEMVETIPAMDFELGYHYSASLEPLVLTLQVAPEKAGHRIKGHFEYSAKAPCSRCLREVPLSSSARFDLQFQPASEAPAIDEVEVSPESSEIVYYDADTLTLETLVIQQMYLEVPEKILCREDCLGLCPRCGANLNDGPCGCPPESDPRWGALSKFKHAQ